MTTADLPLISLARWRDGDVSEARRTDEALRRWGFLLVADHGVDPAVTARGRAEALEFFHQPDDVKAEVAVGEVYRGWVGRGKESNAATYGVETLPDLKETYVVGPPDRPDWADESWSATNRWPADRPALAEALGDVHRAFQGVATDLLAVMAVGLGLEADHLQRYAANGASSLDANWYPSFMVTPPEDGGPQFRVGPHTDFGSITILDRQPGEGGLQVQDFDDRWCDAPFVEGALTVNIGDLMSRWTNGRWRSTRHRVLPPSPNAPSEELLSLILFHALDSDAVIEALPTCVGEGYPEPPEPVVAGEYVGARIAALATGH